MCTRWLRSIFVFRRSSPARWVCRRSILLLGIAALVLGSAEPAKALRLDEKLHLSISTGLGLGGYGLMTVIDDREGVRIAGAVAFSMGIGLAKELWDLATDGHFSGRDLAWDALGTAIGVIVGWVIGVCVRRLRGGREPEPTVEALRPGPEPFPGALAGLGSWGAGRIEI